MTHEFLRVLWVWMEALTFVVTVGVIVTVVINRILRNWSF